MSKLSVRFIASSLARASDFWNWAGITSAANCVKAVVGCGGSMVGVVCMFMCLFTIFVYVCIICVLVVL